MSDRRLRDHSGVMFRCKLAGALLTLVLAFLAVPAAADPPSLARGTVLAEVERFHPGDFLWAPELAPEGPVLVVINRRSQRLIVFRNGVPIGISTVSTGRPGYTTPTGSYRILQKRVRHFSSIYHNAPMPYMQRLTWRGIALHAGELPGRPASHGCIRLPLEFARLLYGVTSLGTAVVITDRPLMPKLGLSAELAAADRQLARHLAAGPAIWEADAGQSGPVTMVASVADARLLVIRNGRITGSAPMVSPALDSIVAFRAESGAGAGQRWTRIALPGQAPADGAPRSPLSLISADPEFLDRLRPLIGTGTTFLLMPDSLAG
jgi:hypothetical protein